MCQGRITPIIVDSEGKSLDAGRTIRHANRRQRRALRAMYSCCAFGDCDIAFDRCEIHHVLPWELGGLTDLANLIPICSHHHHVVHEGGWRLDLADDRTLTITQPDGTVFGRCRPDLADRRHRRRPAA
jgi:predicted HNH restriction endonuclease